MENVSTNTHDSDKIEEMSVEEKMQKNGVPKAPILEDVGNYLKECKTTAEEASNKIQEDYRKYKLIEASTLQQRARIEENILDYKKSLAALRVLQENRDAMVMDVTYKLDENVYSKAVIEDFENVCIWLGANVMIEYKVPEALELLSKNLSGIEKINRDLSSQLDFIRDQITTSEVNIAHLYNYGLQQARVKDAMSS